MKTKIIAALLLVFFLSSCRLALYLPSSDTIDENEYGSFIKIVHKTESNIYGELIAIDSSKIIVLSDDTKKCKTVSLSNVEHFTLKYANGANYGWTIPVYTLATISHGWFLVLTAPINLIVTISINAQGANAFKYSDKNMTFEKLKMFARYPQGIPSNIDIDSIRFVTISK
jgi:hypothetical protein